MTDTAEAVSEARDEPLSVSADVTAEGAIAEVVHAHQRAVGSSAFMTWIPATGALLGLALPLALLPTAYAALFLVNPAYGILLNTIEGGIYAASTVIGYALGLKMMGRTYHRRYLFGMYRRGMPAGLTASYRILDDAFEVDTGRIQYRVNWGSVLEMMPTAASWLVVVDTTTFVVPRSAFADEESQRRFVTALLAHIPAPARERSAEAREFAAAAPVEAAA